MAAAAPLTPAVLHVLVALAKGDCHGYGIQKEVLRHTNGEMRLGPGTLYGTLQRLMESGFVEETDGPAASAPGEERRRYYRLTPIGRRALQTEVGRLEALVRTVRSLRLLPRASRG